MLAFVTAAARLVNDWLSNALREARFVTDSHVPDYSYPAAARLVKDCGSVTNASSIEIRDGLLRGGLLFPPLRG